MQKKILFLVLLTIGFSARAQLILNNSQTPAQLVQNVLLGQGIVVSDIAFNGTVTNANSIRDQAVHFLNGATTNIGIDSGIILSTGRATVAIGPNNNGGMTQATSNPVQGDSDLAMLTTNTVRNAAVLEFDFIPTGQTLSFDFVFASEEYPEWANSSYNDVFGFFLSGPGISGPYSSGAINIALIPSTNVPITINNLNNGTTNNGPCEYCEFYIDNGRGNTPAINTTIQYDGFTRVIPATATVQCGQLYHIKLAIANVGDNSLDSAVFLKANSFNSAPIDFPQDYLVSNGFAPCFGGSTQVCTGLNPSVVHVWTRDGDILNETGPCLTITQPGEYCATAYPYGPGCPVSDCLIVEFQDQIMIGSPNDLVECDTTFNLTQNAAVISNGLDVTLSYHHTQSNAEQLSSPISNPANYIGTDGEIIYVGVEDNITGCLTTTQFALDVIVCTNNPIPTTPPNLTSCESSFGSGSAIFNFVPQTPLISGTIYSATDYTVTYHLNQNDANNDANPITAINAFNSTGQTIFVRLEENADPTSFGTTSFQLIVYPIPTAAISISPATVCMNETATVTFNGTPNAVVTYNFDSNPNQTITLNAGGSATIVTPPLTAASTYNLVSIVNPITNCTQGLTGSTSATVNPLPVASISGTTTICSGSVTTINFTGTPNATISYTANGSGQTIVLDNSGAAVLNTGILTTDTTYTLVSVSSAGTPVCSQAQSGSAVVTVLPVPTATISGSTTICSGTTADIIFSGTPNATVTYTVNAGSNQTIVLDGLGSATITSVFTADMAYSLVSVASSGTPSCGQAVSGSAVVRVNAIPVISNLPLGMVLCSGDAVSATSFVSSPAGGSFSWSNSNPSIGLGPSGTGNVPAFTAINTTAATVTATITVTVTLNGCESTGSYTITVNPVPTVNPVGDYELCDYNNPGDQVEIFTLNSMDAGVMNGQADVTVSYYLSQADAEGQVNPLANSYPNISNPQQVWINIRNNTTGCDSVGSFNLVVNPLPAANTPDPIFQCSNGSTTQAEFDLTLNESVVIGSTSAVTVSYYNTLADAQGETNPIPLPTAYMGTDNEIVYIRVEDNATGCYAVTTQLLRVTQGPVAITPQPLHYCDPNNDGFGVFNLDSVTQEIAGGTWPITGVSISYYETETDALIGAVPSLTSPYENIDPWTQTIYVRVFYTLTGCANYVQLQLIVDPTPEATEPDDYELCDYTGQTGYETFNLLTTVPQILGSINPAVATVTFHPTLSDAQNETATITGVTNYVNQVQWHQTLYVRVEFNATGCYDIVELDLIVNPLPNITQPNYAPYTLCGYNGAIGYEVFDLASQVDAILLGQQGMEVTFYPSLGDAQGGTNVITNLQYQNTIIYVQTLGIRITDNITGCYSISTMDIRVAPLPSPIPPTQPYTICDGNQDGYSCDFDLTTLETDILQGANYILTFHETLSDAELGNTAINTALPYCNIVAFTQTLYVRAEDPNTGCWSVIPIVLEVNPSPIAPFNLNNIEVCDNDNNTQNASTRVDLTIRTADVLAQQPLPASSYTVTYHTSLQNAQDGLAITPPTNYMGSNGQTIWVRVENNATGCYNIGTFQLIINIPLQLVTPTPISLCDSDAIPNDQHTAFNLTIRDAMITQGLTGYTVTYYSSYALAQAGGASDIADPTNYTNIPPAVQTLGVVVTSAAGCKSITTLDIRVLPVPTPNTNPPSLGAKCDDNNPGDMMELFDLTVNAAYIINGDPSVTLHYYHSQADAIVPQNEILTPTNALVGDVDPSQQSVWIRVENSRIDSFGNHCYVLVEQPLTVNPLPAVTQPLAPYRVCDDDTDGFADFDLTNPLLAPAILGSSQAVTDYTISYYLTAAGANPQTNTGETPLPNTYTNISNPQTIYIRVVNNTTGCVNATGELTLAVEDYATATGPQAFASCDDYNDPYDGVFQLDLTQYEAAILNGQNPAVFLVSYYHNQADAIAGTNAIPLAQAQAYITQPDTDQIWVKVENSSNTITPFCYALTTIDIDIERYPNPVITTPNGINTICVAFTGGVVVRPLTLDSNITDTVNYTFQWYEGTTLIAGATGPTYTVDTASPTGATRTYTVLVTSTSALACDTTSAGFDVIQSGQASIPAGTVGYTVTNAFTDSQIITVTVEGWGTYEYSLDDGPRQSSNVFEGVSLGSHVIHVWDTEGGDYSCEELVINDVQVIDYPHYFTPNGDGIHDTWNVTGLFNYASTTKIYIFDRYGKLLKQISSAGDGWDGTYNGLPLPSTDYWFTVNYLEQNTMKEFKAHFSLKR